MRLIYAGLMVLLSVLASGCGPLTFVVGASPGDQQLQVKTLHREMHGWGDRVAIIDVSGLIINAHKPSLLSQGEHPVSLLYEQLEQARIDKRVKAVILRINSPGGGVTATDAMYRMVNQFRKQTGKPVIALLMDVAASGGYYLACSSDEIVAYPTSVIGSIGVIMQTLSLQPALSRIGVQTDAITSGPNKNIGSPLGTLTEEHRQVLQSMVDDFYHNFVAVVRESRSNIPDEQFAMVTDGRIMSAQSGHQFGLVDHLGDLDDAFALAKQRTGLSRANLVIYHRPLEYVGSPYAASRVGVPSSVQVNVAQLNFPEMPAGTSIGFFYLWQP